MSDPTWLMTPQGMAGPSGIVGDLAWNTGAAPLIAGEMLGGFVISKPFTLSAPNSFAYAHVAPTAQAIFTIYSEVAGVSTQIGTVTFAAGSRNGVVVITNASVVQGAWINIIGPSGVDSTLLLVSITLASR